MSKLLLLSNSTMPGTSFFSWPKPHAKKFLGEGISEVLFIPFAAVSLGYDEYAAKVAEAFSDIGYAVRSLHQVSDKQAAIRSAQAIVVGGGNTFALLNEIYVLKLLLPIQSQIVSGVPYIGWSAGANLACPTLKTTNDMPVVMPPSFDALNLVPFQINPHYHELTFENQGGETRKERLQEFLLLNPDKVVIGLPEGMLLSRNGQTLSVLGNGTAKLFASQRPLRELPAGEDVSYLL